ncbi:hypothetical protein MPSEU_001061500 [Mayamaea pseudoterrestris]|nr:hypothetical protein MPSEU_001061500 [Mayamaea pseudoterrestris]
MPKRPLSAYNLFFQSERRRLLASKVENSVNESSYNSCGDVVKIATQDNDKSVTWFSSNDNKLSFSSLAKTVAAKWRNLGANDRVEFDTLAAVDKQRYDSAVAEWRAKNKKQDDQLLPQTDSSSTPFNMIGKDLPPTLERTNTPNFTNTTRNDSPEMRRTTYQKLNLSLQSADLPDQLFKPTSFWASRSTYDFDMVSEYSPLTVGRVTDSFESQKYEPISYPNEKHAISEKPIRLHRSASLPLTSNDQTPLSDPQPLGLSRSYFLDGRFERNVQSTTKLQVAPPVAAQRLHSFTAALPPPLFQLHQTVNLGKSYDTGLQRRHSVDALLEMRQSTAEPRDNFQKPASEKHLQLITSATNRTSSFMTDGNPKPDPDQSLEFEMLDIFNDSHDLDWRS